MGLLLCFLLVFLMYQGEIQTLLARAPFATLGSSVCVLIWTIFVLYFHGGGPHADPHLGLGPLPGAPVGWEE